VKRDLPAAGVLAAAVWWHAVAPGWWRPLSDPDRCWAEWAGEQILKGRFPHHNDLSQTALNTPWTLHETVPAIVYLAWRERHGWATAAAAGWVSIGLSFTVCERPLIFGNLCLALLITLTRTKERHPWAMPLAAILVGLWPPSPSAATTGTRRSRS